MLLTTFTAVVFSLVYVYLMLRQIRFVRAARETALAAGEKIPDDRDGTVVVTLSYLSIVSLALNLGLIVLARQRAVVVRRMPTFA